MTTYWQFFRRRELGRLTEEIKRGNVPGFRRPALSVHPPRPAGYVEGRLRAGHGHLCP